MKDFYLENPEELKGQPKRTIADYVESRGILVPKRFDSLKEAIKSGLPIIARSEHIQEYNGVSGLLVSSSHQELTSFKDEKELKEKILKDYENPIITYCDILSLNKDKFKEEVSFSFWEMLGGYNTTIVADSSIKNRYHITTYQYKGNAFFANYIIFEDGKVIKNSKPIPSDADNLNGLVELYEKVRNLDHFDSNHCPILEVQMVDGKNYFLQYHKTRDFKESQFSINRQPEKDEIEFDFVRGATTPEGSDCKALVSYPRNLKYNEDSANIDKLGDASLGMIYEELVLSELAVRKRKLQFITKKNFDLIFRDLAEGHIAKSFLYKPEVSIACDYEKIWKIMSKEEHSQIVGEGFRTNENQFIPLHVVSDGRKAYIKRL